MDKKLDYFKIANDLNKKHEKKLCEKNLHFRGNLKSFSLVSLDRNTPEIGVSSLKSEKNGESFLEKNLEFKAPKRDTREKELQSWIIKFAQNNNWILPVGDEIRFLTSEIAWSGTKKVNDILGLDKDNDIVIIELKSKRLKTKLNEQVNDFFNIVNDKSNKKFFSDLVRIIAEKKWSGRLKRMIIWPYARTSPLSDLRNKNIIEVCYLEKKIQDKDKNKKVIDYDAVQNIQFRKI